MLDEDRYSDLDYLYVDYLHRDMSVVCNVLLLLLLEDNATALDLRTSDVERCLTVQFFW